MPDLSKFAVNCFTKFYKGCNHSAESCKSSRRSKVVNVENMVSPTTLQRASLRIDKDPPSESVGVLGRPKKFKAEVKEELFIAKTFN